MQTCEGTNGQTNISYPVPLTTGMNVGVFGPMSMSALSHTGLFIPLVMFFSLSISNANPTVARFLKSNLIPVKRD